VTGPERVSDTSAPTIAPEATRVDTTPVAPPHTDGAGTTEPATAGSRTRKIIIEWVLLIGGALLIAFLIKTFLFQAFYIPSESMTPTLKVGDRVLVNKLSYKLHDVNRGDVVVFEAPEEGGTSGVKDLVKRVIGLPGETVELRDGQVFVDDKPLSEPYLEDGETTTPTQEFAGKCAPPVSETECTVPADSYLVFGDNRNESKDGRVFGPIKESDIVGRVFVRIWPLGDIGFL
jgi:signal peptidase I